MKNTAAFCPAAVICEYDPFHCGHELHLARTRSLYGATHIICIMSGNWTQRGDCAIIEKHIRARAALSCGADLVAELPLPWSMSSAEHFARGGVAVAASLGARMLSFGSECGDAQSIMRLAHILDAANVYERSRKLQGSGMTFAAARSAAVGEIAGAEAAKLLGSPNDTLAVEYCRAINRSGCDMEPVCVVREGAAHNTAAERGITSASHIRELLLRGEDASRFVPEAARLQLDAPTARLERIDRAITLRLRLMGRKELAELPDISEGLENRIYKAAAVAGSFEDLCGEIKCKRYTLARIRRAVLSAVLNIGEDTLGGTPPYIRLLGATRRGIELLSDISPTLPLVTRRADAEGLNAEGRKIYELNERAEEIYAMCFEHPLGRGFDARERFLAL